MEGRYIHAQRPYQKVELRTRSLQLWYHQWFSD